MSIGDILVELEKYNPPVNLEIRGKTYKFEQFSMSDILELSQVDVYSDEDCVAYYLLILDKIRSVTTADSFNNLYTKDVVNIVQHLVSKYKSIDIIHIDDIILDSTTWYSESSNISIHLRIPNLNEEYNILQKTREFGTVISGIARMVEYVRVNDEIIRLDALTGGDIDKLIDKLPRESLSAIADFIAQSYSEYIDKAPGLSPSLFAP